MKENIYDHIPQKLASELFEELATGKEFSLKRIVSRGQTTGWSDPDQEEWVILLTGSATLEFEDNHFVELNPGDYLLIPSGTRHRVSHTDLERETIWLALYFSDR
jgi:cupin 2 domain-containing protein